MTKLVLNALIASVIAAVLSSCTSVAPASAEADRAAKAFPAVPEGKSRLYIIRPGALGSGVAYQITVDGLVVGSLPIQAFLVADVPPGNHTIVWSVPGSSQRTFAHAAAAGAEHYIVINNRGVVSEKSQQDGRIAIANSRLVPTLAEVK